MGRGSCNSLYVQFGCGLCAPEGWRNFDASPSLWLEKKLPLLKPVLLKRGAPEYPPAVEYGDIVKGLPLLPGSAQAIYCSHVLEHLALEEFRQALRNVYSYLQPGGTFRLAVPDLEVCVSEYVGASDVGAAERFVRSLCMGAQSRPSGAQARARAAFTRSPHLWMWDEKSMAAELSAAGFIDIRRAQFGDNPDPVFRAVEDVSRWEKNLGMECRRPSERPNGHSAAS